MVLIALMLTGCTDNSSNNDSGTGSLDLFCEDVADGGSFEIEDNVNASIDGANGSLVARIVTDESEDIHNPNYVANVIYVIENLDVGGSPRYGESDITGEIAATLGEGNWHIQISNNRVAGFDCYNQADFTIEAGRSTFLCMDVNCE